jgi:hypothetical protein
VEWDEKLLQELHEKVKQFENKTCHMSRMTRVCDLIVWKTTQIGKTGNTVIEWLTPP